MKKVILVILLVFSILLIGCESQDNGADADVLSQDKNYIDEDSIYIDVNQFSRISSKELIEIMGEPNSKDDWNNLTDRGEFLIEIYNYDGYAFFIADDSVVRMNIYSEKYYDFDGKGIEFSSEESIFHMLNIPVDYDRIKRTENTGYALRYSPVSDKVAEIWCIGIDEEESSIEEIKVTFNLNYF
ncbi:hypothetical protein [Clostridium sp. Cult2]|uniref:hypothetical protein n=1 Tax=Clostridium sp. Cult2 TaxID=2079003 RepID=UPI001F3899D1|nr:hypothetical protein [Clostridium sp. Cult2]MCF6466344.1 hypothetical protein [Clostridium sp. Cult2]